MFIDVYRGCWNNLEASHRACPANFAEHAHLEPLSIESPDIFSKQSSWLEKKNATKGSGGKQPGCYFWHSKEMDVNFVQKKQKKLQKKTISNCSDILQYGVESKWLQ